MFMHYLKLIIVIIITLIGYLSLGYTIFYIITNGIAWYWIAIVIAIVAPILGSFTWIITKEMKKLLTHNI